MRSGFGLFGGDMGGLGLKFQTQGEGSLDKRPSMLLFSPHNISPPRADIMGTCSEPIPRDNTCILLYLPDAAAGLMLPAQMDERTAHTSGSESEGGGSAGFACGGGAKPQ
jgi:hypothetical protein